MRNIAASFIAGSVFVGIVFLLIFDVTPRSEATTEAQEPPAGEGASRSDLPAIQEPLRSALVSQLSDPQPADSPSVALGEPALNPDQRLAELRAIVEAAEHESYDILNARWRASLGPVISPVPLPHEFDWLGESVFHEHMKREPIDSSAASKEAELMAYFISRPQLVERYGTPTVRCHTNRCLVTWVSYGSSETEEFVQSDFRALEEAAKEEMTGLLDCSRSRNCFSRALVEDGLATAIMGVKFEGEEVVPGLE